MDDVPDTATLARGYALVEIGRRTDDPDEVAVITREAIASGSLYALVFTALRVPGADLDGITGAVIATGSAPAMSYFARHVPGADSERLREAMRAAYSAPRATPPDTPPGTPPRPASKSMFARLWRIIS